MQHHAILLEGPTATALTAIAQELLGADPVGHADYFSLTGERFGIEEAKQVKMWASMRPLGQSLVIVLAFETATHEAQNALLKLLEEPPEGVHFVVAVPTRETLLPTVRSRLSGVRQSARESLATERAQAFLAAPYLERLKTVERVLGKEGARDRTGVREFLDELEAELHTRLEKDPTYASALGHVAFVRQYLFDRSASLKQLLEHVALTV